MAREHARLSLEIWNDPDFQEATPDEQRLYMLLLSQKTTNNAGVLPLMPSKWARGSKHTTVDYILANLAGLERRRFVLVDEDTEEVLVRSFIRRDGVANHRYTLKNALTMAKRTESPKLRQALASELRRLGNPDADRVADDLDRSADRTPPEPHSNDIPIASEPGPSQKGEGEGALVGTPAERNVGGPVGRPRSQAKRGAPKGTRLPDDFAVTAEMVEWAQRECPEVHGRRSTEAFIDHFRGKTGRDATKLDWVATWRNWLRRDQQTAERGRSRASPSNGANRTDSNIAALLNRNQGPPNLLALPGGAS